MVVGFIVIILVFIVFFFFGKIHHKHVLSGRQNHLLSEKTAVEVAGDNSLYHSTHNKRLIKLFSIHNFSIPTKGNHVRILADGSEFFISLLQDIARAKEHIHLITYIFSDDALGNLIADALIDKARQGVEVRVIYDDVGCWHTRRHVFDRMRKAGVEVGTFMPVGFPVFFGKINCRNHRKMCIIDGTTGYIGGMNIALRYAKGGRGRTWCDTHVRVEGEIVSLFQHSFCDDWFVVRKTMLDDAKYYPAPIAVPGECLAQLVLSSPLLPWRVLMQGYVALIHTARDYVYIETPYFIPTSPVLLALCTAALSGVDVRVMLPEHADRWFVERAARSYVKKAFDAGVKFYLYTPGINHSKLLVCDDAICSCGSANIDYRSFKNNCEANIFMYDKDTALRMKQIFLGDSAYCIRLKREKFLLHRNYFQRICDNFIRLFSPLM